MPEMIIKNFHETIVIPESCSERFLPVDTQHSTILREKGVLLGGLSELYEGYDIKRERPSFHLVISSLSGSARLVWQNQCTAISPGTILIAPAGISYQYSITDAPWKIAWFHLADNARWKFLLENDLTLRQSSVGELATLMEFYLGEFGGPTEPGESDLLDHLANALLLYLERELRTGTRAGQVVGTSALRSIWKAVNEDLQHHWTIHELADRCCLSPVYFIQKVKRIMGIPPIQVVTRFRMRRAQEYLNHTQFSVKQISYLVGYQDPLAFSTAFRRFSGMSPRKFRAKSVSLSRVIGNESL